MTTSILLLGAILLAAFSWARSFDRSWRLRGADMAQAWQHRHVSNEYVATRPNARRVS